MGSRLTAGRSRYRARGTPTNTPRRRRISAPCAAIFILTTTTMKLFIATAAMWPYTKLVMAFQRFRLGSGFVIDANLKSFLNVFCVLKRVEL